jgi:hypothetical protein
LGHCVSNLARGLSEACPTLIQAVANGRALIRAYTHAAAYDKITTVMAVPELLRHLSDTISHPALTQVGETKTRDGQWALLATVRRGTSRPVLEQIKNMAGDFPVIFEEEAESLPVARPAYPEQGE